jgi:hypothetical protein
MTKPDGGPHSDPFRSPADFIRHPHLLIHAQTGLPTSLAPVECLSILNCFKLTPFSGKTQTLKMYALCIDYIMPLYS